MMASLRAQKLGANMTLTRAICLSALRSAVIMAVIVGSRFPLQWLRPRYYPDGLNGNVVFVGMLVVVMAMTWAVLGWAVVPVQQWWGQWTASHRQELSDTDY